MKTNVLFIYGQDSYSSKRKLEAIKQKYIDASLGDTNLAIIDGESATVDEIIRQLYALPFLTKSRLVVIQNFLNQAKAALQEKILETLGKIPASTVVLFYEQDPPDRRSKLFKFLAKAKSQEFKLLDPQALSHWINNYIVERQASIEPQAIRLLTQFIGPDLWRLSNELEKLTLYTKKITVQDVKTLVVLSDQINIFALLDALGNRTRKIALSKLRELLKQGQPDLYLLAMLARNLRQLALIKSGQHKFSASWRIHPYVLQKLSSQAKNFSEQELKNFFDLLAKIDYEVKIGKMDAGSGLVLFVAQATH